MLNSQHLQSTHKLDLFSSPRPAWTKLNWSFFDLTKIWENPWYIIMTNISIQTSFAGKSLENSLACPLIWAPPALAWFGALATLEKAPGSPMVEMTLVSDREGPHPKNWSHQGGPELTQSLGGTFQMTVFLGETRSHPWLFLYFGGEVKHDLPHPLGHLPSLTLDVYTGDLYAWRK